MKKQYTIFNLICLSVIGVFGLGVLFLWRGNNVQVVENVVDVEVVKYKDVVQDIAGVQDVKIENKEQLEQAERYNSLNNEETLAEETEIETQQRDSSPTARNLLVPFTSQAPELNWGEPWQDACEEAAILMLDAYYKDYSLSPIFSRDEILKMVKWEEEQNWGTSISIDKIFLLAKEYFKLDSIPFEDGEIRKIRKLEILENPTVEEIKESIIRGNPVLVVAYGKDLPNPYYSGDGPEYHALIIRGFTEDKFITNDPGTKRGENFAYYYDDLMNAIHDWNGGDVVEGRRVVLVVDD